MRALFLGAGLVSIAVSLWIVKDRLADIMAAEPDIFYAPLFGVAVFLVTKAFEPTKQQILDEQSADHIRDRASGKVGEAISTEIRRRFDESEIRDLIAVLERNIDAAIDRLSEYYSIRTTDLRFHETMPLLGVVGDDLDKSKSDVGALRVALSDVVGEPIGHAAPQLDLSPYQLVALQSICRDVREAINRRNEFWAYMIDVPSFDEKFAEHYGEAFKIISSDLFKAHKIIVEILGTSRRNVGVAQELEGAGRYLRAALTRSVVLAERLGIPHTRAMSEADLLARAREIGLAIERTDDSLQLKGTLPASFGVMLSDITSALARIDVFDANAG
ncbi:MAG: hypothetical protein AB7H66_03115 [Hyphomonadaceae bacterium]